MITKKITHSYLLFWIITCLFFLTVSADALSDPDCMEIAVIVNRANPMDKMTPDQISDIFLGRRLAFPSNAHVEVFEHKRHSALREKFFRALNGMTLSRINAYWARLQFGGEMQPPPNLKNGHKVLKMVGENPNAIGYVQAGLVDDTVKVVLRLHVD